MREIKFRAWDGKHMQVAGDKIALWLWNDRHLSWPYSWIPMQYTGEKDKNGVEIYEGDIVRVDYGHWNDCWSNGVPQECAEHTYDIKEVVFKNGGFTPVCWAGDEGYPEIDMFEAIGNIYENPELLK